MARLGRFVRRQRCLLAAGGFYFRRLPWKAQMWLRLVHREIAASKPLQTAVCRWGSHHPALALMKEHIWPYNTASGCIPS
jgi:hypothetical protein